jgi:hypothetical protein
MLINQFTTCKIQKIIMWHEEEEFEDIKVVVKIRKSKDRQHND